MWTRAELKERAKAALHRNYWKIMLVSTLLLFLGCGSGGYSIYKMNDSTEAETDEELTVEQDMWEQAVEEMEEEELAEQDYSMTFLGSVVAGIIAIVIFLFIFLFVFAVIFAVDIFLINPISMGGCRFMVKSVEDVAQARELAYGLDHSYKNVVKVMFFMDLHILLWALLFLIPGIVKKYQYYMVPYILTEHPDMEYREALKASRDMMEGNKWNTFVLGLSFLPWDLLGAVTMGAVEVFYVQPYRHLTFAALYCKLKNAPVMNSVGQREYRDSLEGNDRQRQEGLEVGDGL